MWLWDLAFYEDGFSALQEHVDSYCKQKGICLPVKLCTLSEKYIWFHIIKHSVMPHTKKILHWYFKKDWMKHKVWKRMSTGQNTTTIKRLLFHYLFFRFKWSQMIYNFIATNQHTLQTFSTYCTLSITKWVSLL